ncbi:MAG TPA: hypothetical protein VGE77_02300 [Nocardioides sp.]
MRAPVEGEDSASLLTERSDVVRDGDLVLQVAVGARFKADPVGAEAAAAALGVESDAWAEATLAGVESLRE